MIKKNPQPRKKVTAIKVPENQKVSTSENTFLSGIAYVTIIGWIVAYIASMQDGKEFTRFHIRQSFGIHMTVLFFEIIQDVSMIPGLFMSFIWLVYIITMVIMMVQSWRGKKVQVSFLGDKYQQWFSFL